MLKILGQHFKSIGPTFLKHVGRTFFKTYWTDIFTTLHFQKMFQQFKKKKFQLF